MIFSLFTLLQERLLKTHIVKTKLLSSSTLTIMTPEVLLEVFRISWAKETAKKKRRSDYSKEEYPQRKYEETTTKKKKKKKKKKMEIQIQKKMNITDEALIASNAVMNSFLREVVHRAAAAAEEDGIAR